MSEKTPEEGGEPRSDRDENMEPYIQRISEWRWRTQSVSFLFGVLLVIFLWILGAAVQEATDVINLSGRFITIVRAASVGLGTGYYLGASIKEDKNSTLWIFLGIFLTLSVGFGIANDTQILGWIPASGLIIIGAVLSIFAHLTPAIQNDSEIRELFNFISGIATTGVVVIIGISDYAVTVLIKIYAALANETSESTALVIIIGSFSVLIYFYIEIKKFGGGET
jgi:hypothetical protein